MALAEWKYFLQVLRYLLKFEPLTLDSYKGLSLLHCDHTFEIQHSSCQRFYEHSPYFRSSASNKPVEEMKENKNSFDGKATKSIKTVNCPDVKSNKPVEKVNRSKLEPEYYSEEYHSCSTYSYYDIDSSQITKNRFDEKIEPTSSEKTKDCPDTKETKPKKSTGYSDMKTAKSMENVNCPDLDSEYKCGEYFGHSTYFYYDVDTTSASMRLPQPDAGFKTKTRNL